MLDAMTQTLVSELREHGVNAMRAFPGEPPEPDGSAVAVCLKKATVAPGGFGDYMGQSGGDECFGLSCRASFALDVYSGAAEGSAGLSAAVDNLILAVGELSGGFGPGELSIGAVEFDRQLCRMRCRCELGAQFWLVREPGGETEFTGFTVKGMILHGT